CPRRDPSLLAGWRTAAHGNRPCIGDERTHAAEAPGSGRKLLPASLGRHAPRVSPTIPWSNRLVARGCMLSGGFRQPEQFLPRVQALVWDFASASPCPLDRSPQGWFVAVSWLGDGPSRSYTRIAPVHDGAPYFSTFAISSRPSTRWHGRGLSLPRPPAFDFQHHRPAEEGTNQH